MLNLWRRHLRSCPYFKKREPRKWRKCQCPVWVQGDLRGEWVKESLEVRSWEAAQRIVQEWEAFGRSAAVTMKEASDRWIADAEARHLKPLSLRKYRNVASELARAFGTSIFGAVTVDDVRKLREGWKMSPLTKGKRLETIRGFFRFCVDSGWMERNPARGIKSPMVHPKPTLPFSEYDMEKIMWAVEVYREKHPQSPELTQKKLRALILLMRYSGIRISDAVMMKPKRIRDGRLFLYQAKAGHPVSIPLPESVIESLNECEDGGEYYFRPGGTLKTWTTEWQARLKKVFVIAGIPDGHPHRFRDTFATDLLSKGVSLETVSVLLGHQSIRITEKHYAPWVKSRQENLEVEVKKTWG